ncbi:hypothetical protein [Chachezhania antarctica]|uniref:hypothetical protein n=1 Tax=Chachezhania antarctica TaxID=2340860 RepID=UPI000EB2330F|nr:hypothetical protein [Chachezhania antarctica]|tara:strand:- start:3296 stop:3502 length:207 start_codon:yes stop_codon:yes gene_type:complete
MERSADQDLEYVINRINGADDPWRELSDMISERREENAVLGGDDRKLAVAIAFFAARVPLPFSRESQQ